MSTQLTLALVALLTIVADSAMGQGVSFGGGTNTAGAFGSQNIGSTTLGGQVGNQTGAGIFGSGLQGSAFSNANNSLSGLSVGVGNAAQADSFIGSAPQGGGFIGAGRQQGTTGFTQNRNAMGGRAMSGFGQNGFGGQRQRGNTRFGQGTTSQSVILQTRLTVGFDYPRITAPRVTSKLENQMAKISDVQLFGSRARNLGSVTVSVDGRTAVLRGTVPTARDRELAIRLAKLEPGISEVRSDLTIADQSQE